MKTGATKHVRATLEPLQGTLGWVVARLGFDIHAAWPKMVRLRVKVEIAGGLFRTSLFPDTVNGGHFLLINKKMQTAAAAGIGSAIEFTVEPDLDPRPAVLPPPFAKLLRADKGLHRWFGELSESMRREIGKWVGEAKSPEARQRRAEQMTERLMLAMEAETTLPPLLERAFLAQPAARQGWEAMTPNQRRGHLLGIFYYQAPEARDKRLAKLLQDALMRAKAP